MLKIVIATDDSALRQELKKVLKGLGLDDVRDAFHEQHLWQMVNEFRPHILFWDLDTIDLNGVADAKIITDKDRILFIILLSSSESHVFTAFEIGVFDYLIKPLNINRLKRTVNRIVHLRDTLCNSLRVCPPFVQNILKLAIQVKNRHIFLNLKDIILITRHERKTLIHTTQAVFKTSEPLQKLEQRLENSYFFRCHKGYIVNVEMVSEFSPWGNKTYLVKLANTEETALITLEKAKEFQLKYCANRTLSDRTLSDRTLSDS